MKILIDVNGLIALLHTAHPDHSTARLWLASLPATAKLHTCSITEIGFVRVSVAAKLCPTVEEAKRMLSMLLAQPRFVRLADDLGADTLPLYVKKAADVTDGHLLALATHHGAKLSTFDTGIPGAELIR